MLIKADSSSTEFTIAIAVVSFTYMNRQEQDKSNTYLFKPQDNIYDNEENTALQSSKWILN